MNARSSPALPGPDSLLLGERNVLELIATGAGQHDVLDALCVMIDEHSGLMSSVYLLDRTGTQLVVAAAPHLPDAWREATRSFAATPTNTSCGAAVHSRAPVIVTDVATSPLFVHWRDAAHRARIASVWSTPLFAKDGSVLGTFAVLSHEPSGPNDAQLYLVERAKRLASLAVERHRTEESVRESEALAQSEHLLRVMLDTLPVGVAVVNPAGDIIISNPASQRIWGDVIPSGPERYARSKGWWHDTKKAIEPGEWGSVRAVTTGESSTDVVEIEAFNGVRKIIRNSAVPIRDANERITGAVIVNEDMSARLTAEHELRDSLTQMRALTGRLMRAQDEERRRIAQMLHETTAQDLAALKMHLARLTRTEAALSEDDRAALTESIELAERSMTAIRTLSYLLYPPFLDESGLVSAVRWYVTGFSARSGIKVDLDLPSAFERLPQDVETTLFRVVQEALINIHHHAGSSSAVIRLRVHGVELTLDVEDRGRGMPPALLAQLPTGGSALGVGIAGMRERLQQLGGTLDIESSERGTLVRARIPLPSHTS
jgi:signal transduction histidine kinase